MKYGHKCVIVGFAIGCIFSFIALNFYRDGVIANNPSCHVVTHSSSDGFTFKACELNK